MVPRLGSANLRINTKQFIPLCLHGFSNDEAQYIQLIMESMTINYYRLLPPPRLFLVSAVFNYRQGSDVVVTVNGAGFASCQTSANLGVLASGGDRITLTEPGRKWYISGVSSHCDDGQKLKITVHPSVISLAPAPEAEPWFPFLPLPPTLSPTAETPRASWPWPLVPLPVPASSPSSSSSSSIPESHAATPVIHFPLPPIAESPGLPFPWPFPLPSLPPTAASPGLPFPWPFPLPSQPPTAESPGLPFP